MNVLELQENALNLRNQLAELIANGEKEERELNENETSQMASLRAQIDEINAEIAAIEEENRNIEKNNKIEKKEMKMENSFVKVIRGIADGNLSEDLRAAYSVNGNSFNTRGIQATVATAGQEAVAEVKEPLEMAIRNASVLDRIGAKFFNGEKGTISIPKYAGSSVAWKGEVAAAVSGNGAFSETVLAPKRLTAYVDVSKEFLALNPAEVENLLISDIGAAVAEKLDQTVFGSATGDTNTPAGILQGDYVATGTSLTAVTYDDILALEEGVEDHNGTEFMFIVNPKVKYALKGTQMASGLEMVYSNNEIDGYKAVVSNSVASKGILCLDPRDLAVGVWGTEITVDTVSQAVNGNVRIVVNAYVDAKLRGNRISGAIFA